MTAAPSPRWICEAQAPGKSSHEFETFGEEAARACCDIEGWDFIRCYLEGSDSDRRGKDKGSPLISAKQLQALQSEAGETYKKLIGYGVDLPPREEWRKGVLAECVRVDSFKLVTNAQFMKVRNRFRELRGATLLGNSYQARRQSREAGDTLEMRQRVMFTLAQVMGDHARVAEECEACREKGGAIGIPYLLTIAQAKNRAATIRDIEDLVKLPVSRLEQLLFTIRNRIAAREGRGENERRNKKQRKNKGGEK